MHIQVNTDNHIQGSEELTQQVKEVVEANLGRFSSWITRVEVQLSDESSSAKSREDSKRCVMEARPERQQPISASHQGETIDQALRGSAKKLVRLLTDLKDKMSSHKGHTSAAGDQED